MNRKFVDRNVQYALTPKCRVSLLGKRLGLLKLYNNCSYYNPEIMQAAGKKFEADISDLKTRLKTQETETRKANAKFVSSIAAQEKLKTDFDAERKAWAEEKATLVNRAE